MEFFSSIFLLILVLLVPALRKVFLIPRAIAPPKEIKNNRYPFFDFAKGTAISAVVLIHATYLINQQFPIEKFFWINTINNLSRFAVGAFIISSGALLSSGLTYKKIIRIFVPYILICIFVGVFQHKSIDIIVGGILRGDLLPPYYFIPVLFQFYTIYSLLIRFRKNKYFLIVSLLISYFFYLTQRFNYILGVPFFGQFIYLFAFGMTYSENLKSNKNFKNINSLILVIIFYVILQFVFYDRYYNSRFFYAPAVFILLHYLWNKFSFVNKIRLIQRMGERSLWIYLFHFSIESFFVNAIPFSLKYSVYLYIFLITFCGVLGSGLLSAGLNQFFVRIHRLGN